MKNRSLLFVSILILITLCASMTKSTENIMNPKELRTVEYVDIHSYVGTWYEIAKIPNRFQRKCSRNTTATYLLRKDGKIDVINRCVTASGDTIKAKGTAKIVDAKSNAKLKVSFVRLFGISLFWGDYWIIGLDKDYSYAIVGTPGRKYGWILSRNPQISPDTLSQIYSILRDQDYDPEDFEMTPQNWQ